MARKHVVNSQMGSKAPSMTGVKGTYGHNAAPFSAPQSMGGGGIPTVFYQDMGQRKASTITPTQTSGLESRAPRPGTSQRKYGTSNK